MPNVSSGGGVVASAQIVDGTIVNADINASAAIDKTKLTGVAASGANSDITSLSALSTPLSEAQGGTGRTAINVTNGVTTKDTADASGTQNIAHGLGRVPRRVKLIGIYNDATLYTWSYFVLGGAGGSNIKVGQVDGSSPTGSGTGTTFQISGVDAPFAARQDGVVTVDATNIIITWTKVAACSGICNILWEAE